MLFAGSLGAVGATVALVGVSLFVAIPADAASPAFGAADLCKQLGEAGALDQLGVNQGECVNLLRGSASENSNNFFVAACGIDVVQVIFGKNKGQCIKAIRGSS